MVNDYCYFVYTDASVQFQETTLSVMEGECIQPVLILVTDASSGSLAVEITVEVTANDNELKGLGECP